MNTFGRDEIGHTSWIGELGYGTVVDSCECVRQVLVMGGQFNLEAYEGLADIDWNSDANVIIIIVPFQCQAEV